MPFIMDEDRWNAIHDWGGLLVRDWIINTYNDKDPDSIEILDVGTSWGKYRELFPEYPNIDGIEVWPDTVNRESLETRYRKLLNMDVSDYITIYTNYYDIVILGDVLEHMTVENAQLVLSHFYKHSDSVLVVVPYLYEQDEEEGNPYQAHLQDDLTPELMASRYPDLSLVALETRNFEPFKGLYVWRSK